MKPGDVGVGAGAGAQGKGAIMVRRYQLRPQGERAGLQLRGVIGDRKKMGRLERKMRPEWRATGARQEAVRDAQISSRACGWVSAYLLPPHWIHPYSCSTAGTGILCPALPLQAPAPWGHWAVCIYCTCQDCNQTVKQPTRSRRPGFG